MRSLVRGLSRSQRFARFGTTLGRSELVRSLILLSWGLRLSYSTALTYYQHSSFENVDENNSARVAIRPDAFSGFRLRRMLQTGNQKPTAVAHQNGRRSGISEQRAAIQDRASLHGSRDERVDSPRSWLKSAERARRRRRGHRRRGEELWIFRRAVG